MLLTLAAALAVIAQDGSPPPVPLPEVEFVKCVPFTMADGISSGRHEFLVRNTNPTSRLVAAVFTWTRPGRTSSFDALLGPEGSAGVASGSAEPRTFTESCEFDPAIAAAIYADGTAVGDPKLVEQIVDRRRESLQSIRMVMSVLRTTTVGADGIDSLESLDALLKQVAGSDTRQYNASRTIFMALQHHGATSHLPNRFAPRRAVAKATLIEVMEVTARKLEGSIHVSYRGRS
jgi:hypothetical protein